MPAPYAGAVAAARPISSGAASSLDRKKPKAICQGR
jgi:hypothetical protein